MNPLAFVAAVLIFISIASANYVSDREAALRLVAAGKNEEALDAFLRMARGKVSDFQQSDALEQAAFCAQRLKKPDRALELAGQIRLAPMSKTCQMALLYENRQSKETIERFGNEDIAGWPDTIIGDAAFHRGRAYLQMKDGPRAVSDLRRAVDYLTDDNSRGEAFNALGDAYQYLVKDDDRAINAYRQVYSTHNAHKHCHAAISVASILERRKDPAAALQELQKVDLKQVAHPVARSQILQALAETLARMGKNNEALARFAEVLKLEGIPESTRKACERGVKELEGRPAGR